MRYDELQIRIPGRNIPGNQIDDGTGRLGRIFVNGQRCCCNDSIVYGRRFVRMQHHDGMALVQNLHQRIECRIAHVLSPAVGSQLDAVRTECVEYIDRFLDSRVHIRQGQ